MACIFCGIANGEIPSKLVYEDETIVVFPDLHPQAKVHLLMVPKQHFSNILDMQGSGEGETAFSHLLQILPKVVKAAGLEETGFRILVNTGRDAGQTVDHVHFHLLGGETLPM